ncbi:hypothetical protein LCGC14_2700810 [marine sediment metagenome]|uniref:10 kDa chaperonin n=1 Tax=marine sediment metagenome TaxID=412755 RepID=A0A0F9C7N2_9ZZZZ
MLKYLPRGKIAVTPLFDPDTTPSGRIIIPDQAKERCDQGIVKYIGKPIITVCKDCEENLATEPLDIQIGDHVMFSGYTGTFMRLEGEGLLIILPADYVTAVIETEPTDIPGLFFQDLDGDYYTATYEMAMDLIGRGIKDTKWFKHLTVARDRPSLDTYDGVH